MCDRNAFAFPFEPACLLACLPVVVVVFYLFNIRLFL
jgi:hypothetical protein